MTIDRKCVYHHLSILTNQLKVKNNYDLIKQNLKSLTKPVYKMITLCVYILAVLSWICFIILN